MPEGDAAAERSRERSRGEDDGGGEGREVPSGGRSRCVMPKKMGKAAAARATSRHARRTVRVIRHPLSPQVEFEAQHGRSTICPRGKSSVQKY